MPEREQTRVDRQRGQAGPRPLRLMVAAPVRRRGDQRDQGSRDDDAGDRPAPVYEHLTPRLGAAMEDGAGGSEVGVGHLTAGWTRRDVSARRRSCGR